MTLTKADHVIDRAASRLQEFADRAATEGGLSAKLAQPLADDAAFLRKLKPSLIVKRAKGEAPTNQKPAEGTVAPPGSELDERPKPKRAGGPSALVVIGAALVAESSSPRSSTRGHAHPETDRRGIGAAVKNVAGHAGAWFRLEKELAALELKKKTVALGLGIGLGIGAALVALYAIGFLFATIAAVLATFMDTWLALLTVTLFLLLVTGSSPPWPSTASSTARR